MRFPGSCLYFQKKKKNFQTLIVDFGVWITFSATFQLQDSQTSLFSNFFIKNGSYDTIYTFKNYFTTMFFSFQLYPNGPLLNFFFFFFFLSMITKRYWTLIFSNSNIFKLCSNSYTKQINAFCGKTFIKNY